MTRTAPHPDLAQACARAVAGLGLVVDELSVTTAGRRRVVRVAVDRDLASLSPQDATSRVEPVSLDEVAEATRAISTALDESEPMGQEPYVLEVGSPGLSRALTLPRHFRRNVGRLLALTTTTGPAVTGRLVAATPEELTIEGDGGHRQSIPLGDVASARVQVEFSHESDDEEN